MKTPLRSHTIRLAFALGILAISAASSAQALSHTGPENPETIARLERDKPKTDLAFKLEGQAWEAFRAHRYADAERLALRSAALLEGTLFPEMSIGDHQILAETYLVQKQYDLALAETLPWKDNAERGRFGATKVLALLGLGRTDDARRLMVAMVGTPESRGSDRPDFKLPMDEDSSDAALLASAYVVRVDYRIAMSEPEIYDDLKAAEHIAPRNPCVVRDLALYLAHEKRYEEARTYYARVAGINESTIRDLGQRGIAEMDLAIAARDRAKKP